jgi:hypothetical protein
LTKKLQDGLKLKPESEPGISTTRLGDWYANVVYVERRPYVLAVSERTLLPVVFPLKGVKDLRAVLIVHVEEVLGALGLGAARVKVEIDAMRQGHIAKTASRSVLGSLKDFAFLMEAWWEHEQSLLSMSVRLAGAPCRPLKEGFPDQAAREAFERPGGHLRLAW